MTPGEVGAIQKACLAESRAPPQCYRVRDLRNQERIFKTRDEFLWHLCSELDARRRQVVLIYSESIAGEDKVFVREPQELIRVLSLRGDPVEALVIPIVRGG